MKIGDTPKVAILLGIQDVKPSKQKPSNLVNLGTVPIFSYKPTPFRIPLYPIRKVICHRIFAIFYAQGSIAVDIKSQEGVKAGSWVAAVQSIWKQNSMADVYKNDFL